MPRPVDLTYHGISRTTGDQEVPSRIELVAFTSGGAPRAIPLDVAGLARLIEDAARMLRAEVKR